MSRKTDKAKYQKKLEQQLIHQHNHFHFLQHVIQRMLDDPDGKKIVEAAMEAVKFNLELFKERADEVERLKAIFDDD